METARRLSLLVMAFLIGIFIAGVDVYAAQKATTQQPRIAAPDARVAAPAPPAAFSISGTVSKSLKPMPGVAVVLKEPGGTNKTAMTDSQGKYAFTGLPKGAYTVFANRPDTIFVPDKLSVVLTNSDATANFAIWSTYSITGSLIYAWDFYGANDAPPGTPASKLPLNGLEVSVKGPVSKTVHVVPSSDTMQTGVYTIGGLPDGDYVITPSTDIQKYEPASVQVKIAGADAKAPDISMKPYKLTCTLKPPAGSALTSLSGLEVTVTGGGVTMKGVTDWSGRVEFKGLLRGDYTVKAGALPGGIKVTPASAKVWVHNADVKHDFTVGSHAVSGFVALSPGAEGCGCNYVQLYGVLSYTEAGPKFGPPPDPDHYYTPSNVKLWAPNTNISLTSGVDPLRVFLFTGLPDGTYYVSMDPANFWSRPGPFQQGSPHDTGTPCTTPAHATVTVNGADVSSVKLTCKK